MHVGCSEPATCAFVLGACGGAWAVFSPVARINVCSAAHRRDNRY